MRDRDRFGGHALHEYRHGWAPLLCPLRDRQTLSGPRARREAGRCPIPSRRAARCAAQHRYDEAIAEYEAVIALNRNWAHAYSHLGRCKFMTGSIEELIPEAAP